MRHWKPRCTLLLLSLCATGLCACMELVRRSEPAASRPDPWWTQPGNPADPEDVKQDTAMAAGGGGQLADSGAPASSKPPPEARPNPRTPGVARASLTGAHEDRGLSREESTRRVNEYAYWCIEQGMWDEARHHLERAAGEDSLAASLFNNLGVIYERLGETEQAETAYARAAALVPNQGAYQANLSRLRERAEAAVRAFADSTESGDATESDGSTESGDDSSESSVDPRSSDQSSDVSQSSDALGPGGRPLTTSMREESSRFAHP